MVLSALVGGVTLRNCYVTFSVYMCSVWEQLWCVLVRRERCVVSWCGVVVVWCVVVCGVIVCVC